MRRHRRDLAGQVPDAARRAATNLPLERLAPFEIVAGYTAFGAELDPGPVLERFAARGAIMVLPEVVGSESPLCFTRTEGAGVATPDLIIAPLLAFDRDGGRLGQGGGHYDRTIAHLRARGPLFVIGLAYAGQEVDAVPHEPHDQPLNAILTEIGYTVVRKDV